ncbi:ALP1-like protein isoform X1 [Tanacetum coccineum]
MSDSSSYSNASDLDDIHDINMVMQLINQDQQVQGESPHYSRNAINRERDVPEALQGIENYIQTHDPLPANFFVRPDATGLMGYSVIMKCTSAILQLAYSTSPDALDEYLQMRKHCTNDCLYFFSMCIVDLFMAEFLRKPDVDDTQTLYAAHNSVHGLPRMLDNIDCMQWEWISCPKSWHEKFGRAGANNDLTVLNHSLLFDDLLDDIAPVVPYEVNGVTFEKGYYLADGIYSQWATFVKSFTVARDEKNAVFKRRQESARKDVERAFGVLQGRWHIIARPARAWTLKKLRRIMYMCIILHNMI